MFILLFCFFFLVGYGLGGGGDGVLGCYGLGCFFQSQWSGVGCGLLMYQLGKIVGDLLGLCCFGVGLLFVIV